MHKEISLFLIARIITTGSQGCRKKASQTEWLKTTGIYSLAVLEAKSLKPRCQLGSIPSAGSGEASVLTFRFLAIAANPWGSFTYSCISPISVSSSVVLPVVMYGCKSRATKKAERRRIDAFKLWCWRRLLRVKEIKPVNPKGDQP